MASTTSVDAPLVFLKSVFAKYDKDNNNTFNTAELGNLCYDLGYCLNDEEVNIARELLDKGKILVITFSLSLLLLHSYILLQMAVDQLILKR